jgi:hypothetical protein
MTQDLQVRNRKTRRLWAALAVLAAILAVLIVPPLVSMSRYKSRITRLMSESLGRPVRLASVEFRLFPTPGFVLTDLTVEEDPAYGAEPVLHANSVTASIRLLSLWRGRLEISSVSVDEASLNVVRTQQGRWNLDPLFRTAATGQPVGTNTAPGRGPRLMPLPYMEATNSRINFKNGAEKLPFSLVDTDLSFWQEQPGDWRIRLRGQPARTDVSLDMADTGLVRLEATAQRAPALRQMPVHLDLEWREAQLGQLMRLVIGSDPGWRGDLTGEMHVDGTAEAADIKTRLRATGVHRAEFAPAAPMDFDASCGFQVHYSSRSMEKLACDSPLGDGRVRLAGSLPGGSTPPHVSIELDRIPIAAGLDALRTIRSGFGPGLEALGTVSGKLSYSEPASEAPTPAGKHAPKIRDKAHAAKARPAPPGPLTGSLTVDGFRLSGDGLSVPIQAAKILLQPVAAATRAVPPGQPAATAQPAATIQLAVLETTVAIPAGAPGPLTVTARLGLSGYELTVHGQASLARVREMAHVVGMAHAAALDAVAGDPLAVDLAAAGPWMPVPGAPFTAVSAGVGPSPSASFAQPPPADALSGTVTLHNANWRADYLTNHVQIAQATLHLGQAEQLWDPVVFTYGPVKGTASLHLPLNCEEAQPCLPSFTVHFGDLDASALQAAILGAREPGTLLSTLIARLTPANATPAWPQLEGTVTADSLILGPVKLQTATATLHITQTGAEITGLDADLLGGHVHGGGTLTTATGAGKPAYTLEGHFEKLSPAEVGQLVGLRWTGGEFAADGKIDLAGFTGKDLAASVKGTLHFDWRRGTVDAGASDTIPAALARFDRWTADAAIANGMVTLQDNQVQQGSRKQAVEGSLTLGEPPKVSFVLPKETQAQR